MDFAVSLLQSLNALPVFFLRDTESGGRQDCVLLNSALKATDGNCVSMKVVLHSNEQRGSQGGGGGRGCDVEMSLFPDNVALINYLSTMAELKCRVHPRVTGVMHFH